MKPIGRRVLNVMIVIAASACTITTTGVAHAGTSTFGYRIGGDAAATPRLDTGAGRTPAGLATAGLSAQQVAKREAFAKRTGRSVAVLSGPWHFVNRHSDKCLTVSGASTANNASAVQYTCDTVAPHNEDWYLESLPGMSTVFHIINGHSGKCLTISGASINNNAGAVQYTCENTFPFNEGWVLGNVYGTGQYWHVINWNSNKCLTVSGASVNNNAGAVQFTCDSTAPFNEEWEVLR